MSMANAERTEIALPKTMINSHGHFNEVPKALLTGHDEQLKVESVALLNHERQRNGKNISPDDFHTSLSISNRQSEQRPIDLLITP